MRMSNQYADAWVDHLIEKGGNTPVESSRRATGTGTCDNCERATEFLFSGFKFQNVPPAVVRDMTEATLHRMKAVSQPFITQGAEVCLRCRPLSNLEMEELSGH